MWQWSAGPPCRPPTGGGRWPIGTGIAHTRLRLADETLYWPVDWDRYDLLSAMDVVRGGLAECHHELSGEAVEALVWEFSYVHR